MLLYSPSVDVTSIWSEAKAKGDWSGWWSRISAKASELYKQYSASSTVCSISCCSRLHFCTLYLRSPRPNSGILRFVLCSLILFCKWLWLKSFAICMNVNTCKCNEYDWLSHGLGWRRGIEAASYSIQLIENVKVICRVWIQQPWTWLALHEW